VSESINPSYTTHSARQTLRS